jgi:hypothetical protein
MDFKHQLFEINTLRYTLIDLERLVSKQLRFGFRFLQDLTEYHLCFNAISSHLLDLAFSRDVSSPSCTYSPSTHPYAPLSSSDCKSSTRIIILHSHTPSTQFSRPHNGSYAILPFSRQIRHLQHPFRPTAIPNVSHAVPLKAPASIAPDSGYVEADWLRNTQGRFQGNHQGNQPSEVVGTL